MKILIIILFLATVAYAEIVIDQNGKWQTEQRKNGVSVGVLTEPSTTYIAILAEEKTDDSICAIYQEIVIVKTGKKLSIQIGSASGLTAQDIIGLQEQGYSVKKVKG